MATLLELPTDRLLKALDNLEGRAIKVRSGQCARIRHRRSQCTRCSTVCPTQAIRWDGSIRVDREACIDCGLCASACPSGALESQAPTDLELAEKIREKVSQGKSLVFTCSRLQASQGGTTPRGLEVGCLGRLDESILAWAVACGARELLLMHGSCEDCQLSGGRGAAEKAVAKTLTLLRSFGVSPRISFVSDLPEKSGPGGNGATTNQVSRRDFFAVLSGRMRQTAGSALAEAIGGQGDERPPTRGELPVRVPTRRRLLLAALKRLGKPASPIPEGANLPWAEFEYGGSCTGCQMCAHFCPTGALSKSEHEGSPALVFRRDLCTNCGLCKDLCYRDAVVLSAVSDLTPIVQGAAWLLPLPKPESPRQWSRRG